MNDTMQDRPYITVMVPVYNGENFLRQAVDSVLSQPCGDFEVLILDDGSTDRTREIGEAYAAQDNRVHFFTHENVGLGQNRNLGYPHVRGKWLIFLDHDDVMFPGVYTEELRQALEKCESTGIEMIVNSRVRSNEQLGDLRFDRIPTNGIFPSHDPVSWKIPYELATNVYSADLVLRNSITFATTRPEMESIFRHQCAYLANRVMFCNQGFIEIRRASGSQITNNWNRMKMRAVRLAEYSKLPAWHKVHGDDSAAVSKAYEVLSGTIVDFFDAAARAGLPCEDIDKTLSENAVRDDVLQPRAEYTKTARDVLRHYRAGRLGRIKADAILRGLVRVAKRRFATSDQERGADLQWANEQFEEAAKRYPAAILGLIHGEAIGRK